MSHRTLRLAQILWPAFLMAGILEMLVFSVVDPSLLQLGSWQPDARTVYSLAFLVFWVTVSAAIALSLAMMRPQMPVQDRLLARRARRHARRHGAAMAHQH